MAELMCQHCGFSNQNAGTTCALCGQPLSQSEEQKAATFVKAADTVVADEDSSAEVDENSGAKKVEAEEDSGAEKAEEVAGWTERELCPDGTCLGVIGPDGRCKICGKSGNGEPRPQSNRPTPRQDEELAAGADSDQTIDAAFTALADRDQAPTEEWDKRELCPDGACLGVIDNTGHCNICGKEKA